MEIELNQDNIPEFLKDSQLYKNFDFTDEDSIKIPTKYFKSDTSVNSFEDLINLMHVNRFWMVEDTQFEIYDFVLNNKKIGSKLPFVGKKDYEQFSNMQAYKENEILTGNCIKPLDANEKRMEGYRYEIKKKPCQMINYAIRRGYFNLVKYFHKNRKKYPWNVCSSFWAMKNLHFDIFMYLVETKCSINDGCLILACETRDIRFLSYLLENYKDRFLKSEIYVGYGEKLICRKINEFSYIKYAAGCNLIENVKLLRKHGFEWHLEVSELLACCGYLELLKFAYDDGCPCNERTCITAASFNRIEVLKYLHENGCILSAPVLIEATKSGNFEMIKYLHENGCPWNTHVCAAATLFEVEILKYLHENGCPWDYRTTEFASEYNNIECLKYAHQNGCPIYDNIFLDSLRNMNFEIFKYASENNFPFDNNSGAMDYLTELTNECLIEGNYKFSKYLIENEYSYSNYNLWLCCYSAKEQDKQDFLNFALPLCSRDSSLCDECAGSENDCEILKFLIENGCKIDEKEIMVQAASNRETGFLIYLNRDLNIPLDVKICNSAIENDNISNLRYLYEKNCPWDETSVFRAIEYRSYQCLRYLLDKKCPSINALDYTIKNGDLKCLKILTSYDNIFKHLSWNIETIFSCIYHKNNSLLDYMIDYKLIDKETGKDMVEAAGRIKNIEAVLILVLKGFEINDELRNYISTNYPLMPKFNSLEVFLKGIDFETKKKIKVIFPDIYFRNLRPLKEVISYDSESDRNSESDY